MIYNNYAGKMNSLVYSFTGQNDSYTQIQNRLHQLNQPLPHTHSSHTPTHPAVQQSTLSVEVRVLDLAEQLGGVVMGGAL